MRRRVILKLIGLTIVALIVGAIVRVATIDPEDVRWLLAEQVEAQTGRKLEIRGKVGFKLSLRPSIVLNDVAFANASWGSRPAMAMAKRLELQIALRPLLSGRVEIGRLILIEPDILLERNLAGEANWQFSEGGPQQQEGMSLRVGQFRVENARILYRGRASETFEIGDLDVRAERSGRLGLSLAGRVGGHALKASGTVGSLADLLHQTHPFPIDLAVAVDQVDARVMGSVGRIDQLAALDLAIEAVTPEAARAAALIGIELAPVGAAQARFRVRDSRGRIDITDIDASIGSGTDLEVLATGQIRDVLDSAQPDLAVTLHASRLDRLAPVLGIDLPALGSFKALFDLTRTGDLWRFARVEARLGATELRGSASYRATEPPSVAASLTSPEVDLADFLPAASASPRRDPDRLLPEDPLPLDWIGGAQLDLTLSADRLVAKPLRFTELSGRLVTAAGAARLNGLNLSLAGGHILGDVEIETGRGEPKASLKLSASRIGLGEVLKQVGILDSADGGQARINLDLKGQGRSIRALMAGAEGQAEIAVRRTLLKGAHADLLALDVIRQLIPWGDDTRDTDMRCFFSHFDIMKGVAESRALVFDTSRMTVAGQGKLDLATERLDFRFVPEPKETTVVGFATAIDLGGTLVEPTVAPNALGLARGLVGAVGDIVLLPLGLLGSLLSNAEDQENPCRIAAAKLRQAGPPRTGDGK